MRVAFSLVLARNLADHGSVRLDHRERRFEIVRYVGNQLLLHRVGFGNLRTGVFERGGKVADLVTKISAAEVEIVPPPRQLLRLLGDLGHGLGDEHGDEAARRKRQYHRKQTRHDRHDEKALKIRFAHERGAFEHQITVSAVQADRRPVRELPVIGEHRLFPLRKLFAERKGDFGITRFGPQFGPNARAVVIQKIKRHAVIARNIENLFQHVRRRGRFYDLFRDRPPRAAQPFLVLFVDVLRHEYVLQHGVHDDDDQREKRETKP